MPLQLTEIAKARRRIADHNKLLKTTDKTSHKASLPRSGTPVFSSIRTSRTT